jgi:NAD(P)-dependent dehydrogenase (short-subunit alcohol dehydrogenase family)
MRLDGKVALITGGGGAMGGAQARLFSSEGAAVCVADLFPEKADIVVKEIESGGGRALAVRLDVQRADEWAEAVMATERAFGPVSILCNNAGANVRVDFDEQT